MKKINLTSAPTFKHISKTVFVFLLMILAGFSDNLIAQTYVYVKQDALGSNNGTSWTNAYTSLQSALGAAVTGHHIWVAAGTYTPSQEVGGTGDRFKTFQLKNGVELYGGFLGNEDPLTFDLNERNFETNETILSGDLGSVYVYHVFRHVDVGLNSTAVLDGFTISGGKADGSDLDNKGGGMLNSGSSSGNGSSPSIRNCVFKNNEAAQGGALYNSRYSSPLVSYTTFSNNTAATKGGAVFNIRNNPEFSNCNFIGNEVTGSAANDGGGAMYNSTSNAAEGPVISHCLFNNNIVPSSGTATYGGGAIFSSLDPGTISITFSTFTGNSGKYGGAIYHRSGDNTNRDASDVKISNSTFEENNAAYGGAIFSDRHNTIVTSCIIRGNEATEQSGGYYGRYGLSKIINSLLSGNKSGKHGGSIYFNNETPEIINTTVSGNYSGERGGGISMIGGSTVAIKNTIVWGNASPEGSELWVCDDCTANIDHSLYGNATGDVHTATGGTVNPSGSLNSDPQFFNPVTATFANTPNTSGIFMIESSSPAIDAGDNNHLNSTITEDLRGGDRIVDGDGDNTATIDIGAYEYNPLCGASPPVSGSGTVTDPYIIAEPGNFCWMAQNPADWNKHYKQSVDIDLIGSENLDGGNGLLPIGNNTTFFSGSYDGQGNNISNLSINRNTTTYVGLFGIVNGGTLNDVHLIDADITGGDNHTGILAGRIEKGTMVSNSSSSGTVKGVSRVGGLIGSANDNGTQVINTYSTAGVTGEGSGSLYTGGLIGEISSSASIDASYAKGTVTGRHRVGGLVGAMGWNSKVENCYAKGNLSLTDDLSYIGGLVGEVWRAKVVKSYSTGYVDYYTQTSYTEGGTVNDWGGLVGKIDNGGNFEDTDNFWDVETSGLSTSEMGTGKTTSEMKTQTTFTNWDFTTIWAINPGTNDGYPHLQFSLFTWTGFEDSDWGKTANWNPAEIPPAGFNINIPGSLTNYPEIDDYRLVGDITIASGASLAILPNAGLTVNGSIANNAGIPGMIIKSDATGTGSLIHHTADVPATVERYFPGAEQWRLVASPVASQVISDVNNWTPAGNYDDGTGYDFYAYDEGNSLWLNQKVGANNINNFMPGIGYLVSFQAANPTKAFGDNLNSENVIAAITRDGVGSHAGANLIGNPYASGIDWNLATRTLFDDDFAYLYDPTAGGGAGGYEEVDGSQPDAFIAPHQGFFVLANTSGNFTFNNSLRVHGGTFTKYTGVQDQLVLRFSNNTYYDLTTLRILGNTDFTRDRSDAIKMYSFNQAAPQMYSYTGDQIKVAVNSIPSIPEDGAITLGLLVPDAGEYSISLAEIQGEFNGQDVYLEDVVAGITQKLTENAIYSFNADKGEVNDRFLLKFGALNVPELPFNATIHAYTHGNTLYVMNQHAKALVEVYNIQGQVVLSNEIGQGLQSLQTALAPGAYIVKMVSGNTTATCKVVIK